MLFRFARTLATHMDGILAYYDYPISTGPLEGTNNKIKTMKRQAYGFRDRKFFKLKILALHMTQVRFSRMNHRSDINQMWIRPTQSSLQIAVRRQGASRFLLPG